MESDERNQYGEESRLTASRWDGQSSVPRHQEDMAVSHLNNQTINSLDYGRRKQNLKPQVKPVEDDEDEVDSSALSTSRRANRDVLSNLCDKIQSVQGLMNGHVRNIFNLEDFVEPIYEDENIGESDS